MKKEMTKLVERVLTEQPFTRKSDDLLVLEVMKRQGIDVTKSFEELTMTGQLKKRETITRCRRYVQERHPELVDTDVAAFRQDKEKQTREYYGSWLV